MSSTLSRTTSLFVAPSPRAISDHNMSLTYDHRQTHPGSLYTDENHTHFNTPNGVTEVPRPLQLGSDEWKIAQFVLKKTTAEDNGEQLSQAQIKRTKQAITKAAKSYNDKRQAEEKLAEDIAQAELLRKQRRKDAKKLRLLDAKKTTNARKLSALTLEADTLFSQCEKLHITPTLSSDETDETVIIKCQYALTKYITRPLTKHELEERDNAEKQQHLNISAEARSKEIFIDSKTHLVSANQIVHGEDFLLPLKKKKNNKKKLSNSLLPNAPNTSDLKIDWEPNLQMGDILSKKQRREIVTANKAANSV